MESPRKRPKPFGGPPKKLLEEDFDSPVRGPLFPRPVFLALLVVFGVSLMLAADWFGLLLLNPEGVRRQLGPLNSLRVTGVLMTGICLPSVLLMLHYRRLYSYISEQNVFFAITFSISFMLGLPCVLFGVFG